jgi:hypothetical protein
MGMSYAQLTTFGRLRKVNKLGPFGMFQRLVHEWQESLSPKEVADLVKRFHHYYVRDPQGERSLLGASPFLLDYSFSMKNSALLQVVRQYHPRTIPLKEEDISRDYFPPRPSNV